MSFVGDKTYDNEIKLHIHNIEIIKVSTTHFWGIVTDKMSWRERGASEYSEVTVR